MGGGLQGLVPDGLRQALRSAHSVSDAVSRCLLAARILKATQAGVKALLEEVFAEAGLQLTILRSLCEIDLVVIHTFKGVVKRFMTTSDTFRKNKCTAG